MTHLGLGIIELRIELCGPARRATRDAWTRGGTCVIPALLPLVPIGPAICRHGVWRQRSLWRRAAGSRSSNSWSSSPSLPSWPPCCCRRWPRPKAPPTRPPASATSNNYKHGFLLYADDNDDRQPPDMTKDGFSLPGSWVLGNAQSRHEHRQHRSRRADPHVGAAGVYRCPRTRRPSTAAPACVARAAPRTADGWGAGRF